MILRIRRGVRLESFIFTPKEFRPKAQGCLFQATLGEEAKRQSPLKGLRLSYQWRHPCGVRRFLEGSTQGSSQKLATLGYVT